MEEKRKRKKGLGLVDVVFLVAKSKDLERDTIDGMVDECYHHSR